MSHQPAFDHPFLKDHKIQVSSSYNSSLPYLTLLFSSISQVFSWFCLVYQMRPTYHPEGLFDESKVAEKASEKPTPINQLWHVNGKCPEGTIPIRRTKHEDVLRASSVKRYGRKKLRSAPIPPRSAEPDLINQSGHQVIITFLCFIFSLMFFFCLALIFFVLGLFSMQ